MILINSKILSLYVVNNKTYYIIRFLSEESNKNDMNDIT